MKNFKKLLAVAFTLAVMVTCFMASSIMASASSGTGSAGSCPYTDQAPIDLHCDRCGLPTSAHTVNVGPGYNGYGGSTTLPDPGYVPYHTGGNTCTTDPNGANVWRCGERMTYLQSNYYAGDGGNPNKYYYQCPACGDIARVSVGGGGSTPTPSHTHSYGGVVWGDWRGVNASNHQRTGTQTCTSTSGTCSAKTKTTTATKAHDYQWTDEYRNSSGTQHQRKQVCTTCGYENWVSLTHNWVEPPKVEVDMDNLLDFSTIEVTIRSLSASQCEHKLVCTECGTTKWETRTHKFETAASFTSLSATQHCRVQTCVYCNYQKNSEVLSHNFKAETIKGLDGHRTLQKCTVCGYIDESAPLQPHTYGTPNVVTSNGVKTTTKVCTVCGYQDQTFELAGGASGSEVAIVLSEPMTLDEIRTNARTGVSSPVWKAVIGTGGDFNTANCGTTNYVWHYQGRAYTLSKRADGLYYVTQLPSYYDSRLVAYNPNGTVRVPSGSSYSTTSTSTSSMNQMNSDGSTNASYAAAMQAGGKAGANWGLPGVDRGGGSSNVGKPPSQQSWSSGGKTYTWDCNADGSVKTGPYGMPKIKETSTVEVYVHYCSYSTSYQDYSATQHTAITVSCCGGRSESKQNHNYGNWTYTDLGPELHRGERVCKQCGHIDTKVEAHYDNNNDTKCDCCTRVLWATVTWRWYDEHTPVVDTTQKAG